MRSNTIVIGRVEVGMENLAEYSGSVEIEFALKQTEAGEMKRSQSSKPSRA